MLCHDLVRVVLDSLFSVGKFACLHELKMAYEKEMTQQFISDVAFWAKLLNIACGGIEEVVIKDEDKDILLYKIRFDSGFEVWALPSKAGGRYFSAELVRSVAVKDKGVFRFAADDSFTFEKAEKREKEMRKWFKQVKPTLLSTDLSVCLGEDFARSGDITVLHFDTELSDGSMDTLCVIVAQCAVRAAAAVHTAVLRHAQKL